MSNFYAFAFELTLWLFGGVSAGVSNSAPKVIGRPFQPGVSGNPAGYPKSFAEVRRMAQERSIRAVERLSELMEAGSGRVAIAACIAIYEIGYGKLGSQKDPGALSDPTQSNRIDLSRLSGDELRQFRELALKAKATETT